LRFYIRRYNFILANTLITLQLCLRWRWLHLSSFG